MVACVRKLDDRLGVTVLGVSRVVNGTTAVRGHSLRDAVASEG
jgi:hypothetical protein